MSLDSAHEFTCLLTAVRCPDCESVDLQTVKVSQSRSLNASQSNRPIGQTVRQVHSPTVSQSRSLAVSQSHSLTVCHRLDR
eukprot:8062604-Pyramimonas_sp.AAC.1